MIRRIVGFNPDIAGGAPAGPVFPREDLSMAQRKKIQVFSAGCLVCQEAITAVRHIAGADHDVEVLDMHQADVAARARQHGIRSVPSVVVNGHLQACRTDGGVDEAILRSAMAAA
jgi:hypothetical protein